MASRKVHGVQRVITKIEAAINNGNYYEAHQMYRTLYFRYLSQEKYSELLDLLYDGAVLLLTHDQQGSGADVSNLYLDVLVKSKSNPTDENTRKVARLFELINSDVPERESFLNAAIRWSVTHEYKSGYPMLHQSIAQIFWKEKNYMLARRHFLRSYDGSGFATMLVEIHRSTGYTTEVDLFIAQVVLQCLCLENKKTAVIAFQCYTTQHPYIHKGPPYLLPLLNFIWFLLQLLDRSDGLKAFTVLCEQYQLSIERDPTYSQYLDKIGQIFFGLPPPKPQAARPSLLRNMFQSLMNGMEEFSSSDEEEERSSRRGTQKEKVIQVMDTQELD